MKIEKKLIAISILAITIGIATVMPMTIFMNAKANDTQTYADPWFNIESPFAYLRVDSMNGGYRVTDLVQIYPSLNSDAVTQQETRMEFFECTFSTDDGEFLKEGYWISMTNGDPVDRLEIFNMVRNIACNTTYLGVDGLWGLDVDRLNALTELSYKRALGRSFGDRDDKFSAVLTAQTIHLDIRRLCYVTISNDNTVITWTWTDNSVIQHLELIKNGGAFTFGTENANPGDEIDNYAKNFHPEFPK
jgi:hypothetical protein